MAEEEKDSFVTMVNPDGVEEEVWSNLPGHVDRLLTLGWSYPVPKIEVNKIQMKSLTITTDKE